MVEYLSCDCVKNEVGGKGWVCFHLLAKLTLVVYLMGLDFV